ncbi:GntR family transcriptional regulator [Paenibacillus ehimensis]|uniref:GntR family transcriptional regulator n=1 Tax=Paenibacillus ehimensis TaxID=79264 RepID=A0ABT8VAN9_9BACL|nr:GntR family transcriptional regulator [Paenibacillus ehimensis]MDO3678049.1 GntR family transcriptional regulator [Paenibacillus ehimensis]
MQLKQMINEEIHRGTYKPGQQLPSESDLCDISMSFFNIICKLIYQYGEKKKP